LAEPQENLSVLSVGAEARGERLDRWLATALRGPDGLPVSRSRVQRLIESGDVLVDGKAVPAKHLLAGGETVGVRFGPPPPSRLEPVAMPLSILYEDEHLIVLDKPAGVAMHPGAGDTGPTLVQGLLAHVAGGGAQLSSGAPLRPGIVHRLDKDTTGVVVVAKSDAAHASLAKQFHDKTNLRAYAALLDGSMGASEIVHESYLYRDPRDRLRFASMPVDEYRARGLTAGRYARSRFLREKIYGHRLTLARVVLSTGRTHQIRVHAADLRLPIVGDPVYNRPTQLPKSFDPAARAAALGATRQMLHAQLLGFMHPATGAQLQFTAPYPEDFRHLLELLDPYAQTPNS
jgi:23S rRNA pseudouridine1911/1915/1917 synthase